MSKERYEQWGFESYKDNKTGVISDDFLKAMNKQDQHISDLEAKLTESEKNVEFYKERYSDATTSAYGADLMAKDYQWHLEKEIAELKQQLAESKEEIKVIDEDRQFKAEMWTKFADKCKDLKQQLAEKELDIIRWKEHFNNAKMDYECLKEELEKKDDEILKGDCAFVKEVYNSEQEINELKKQLAEKEKELRGKETLNQIFKDNRENKISFALEQLEKVKETTECILDNALKNSSLNQSYYDRLLDEIDNQIVQLTHQHEDKGE